VNDAFKALGLEDLLQDQPSGRDLLLEVFRDSEIEELKQEDGEVPYIYKVN
jgi:hypothetical protein